MTELVGQVESQVETPIADGGDGRGGDMVFVPGQRHSSQKSVAFDGCFVLKMADGEEFMRVKPTGEVLVRGNVVDTDRKVYESFREWLAHALP